MNTNTQLPTSLIDVIIPAYNCTTTLDRTLCSLVAQTNPHFQVTLVDDCSTEDLTIILDHYQKLLNIRYIQNPQNLGCGMSRQAGIDHSFAPYLTFLDSDDVMMPYAIEVFYRNIRMHPDTPVFHSHFYKTDVSGEMHSVTDGLTWCHGRLYQRKFLEQYHIRNLPEIKYCDDSFFNSICDELNPEPLKTIPIPMMMWLYNDTSITRNKNGAYKEHCLSDFLHGIRKSTEFILQYKPLSEIMFLEGTLTYAAEVSERIGERFSVSERKAVKEELTYWETLLSPIIPPVQFRKLFRTVVTGHD